MLPTVILAKVMCRKYCANAVYPAGDHGRQRAFHTASGSMFAAQQIPSRSCCPCLIARAAAYNLTAAGFGSLWPVQ